MYKILEINSKVINTLFYGITQKELRKIIDELEVKTIYNIGTDGIGYMIKDKINFSSEESFNKWLKYHFETCEDDSILGHSLHVLYFGI
ncbi:hypothetical protein [Clostridium sp.]|uniref:hypothetical protein n=1 Tax=Clostridium sp. TaxID=1506 RepID=UPI003463D8B0